MEVKFSEFMEFIRINSDLKEDELLKYAKKEWDKWIKEIRGDENDDSQEH